MEKRMKAVRKSLHFSKNERKNSQNQIPLIPKRL